MHEHGDVSVKILVVWLPVFHELWVGESDIMSKESSLESLQRAELEHLGDSSMLNDHKLTVC